MRLSPVFALVLSCGFACDAGLDGDDPWDPPVIEDERGVSDGVTPSGSGGSGPRTGGVPWNGARWEGMPWSQTPTEALGQGYAEDGSVALNTDNSNGLEETAEGREVLKYLAQCALGGETPLRFQHAGVSYEYYGLLNIAPAWGERALDELEQAWLSACVLASVNAGGLHVPFSPRGKHSALMARLSPEEMQEYSYEEAAFYGDIFGDLTYVCVGRELTELDVPPEGAPTLEIYLNYRLCSITESCGYQRVGTCYSLTDERACNFHIDDATSNLTCFDTAAPPPGPSEGQGYQAVITTFITPGDAQALQDAAMAVVE